MLLVNQTQEVQSEIAQLLKDVRGLANSSEARRKGLASGGTVHSSSDLPKSAAVRKIEAALELPTEIEFVDTPLSDVVDFLNGRHQIDIQLDRKALDEASIPTDTPVKKSLKGISLRSALKTMLGELGLTYVIQDDVLLITTKQAAEQRPETVAYDVSDLLQRYRDENGHIYYDFESLIDVITSAVDPTTWDAVGGTGSVAHQSVGERRCSSCRKAGIPKKRSPNFWKTSAK